MAKRSVPRRVRRSFPLSRRNLLRTLGAGAAVAPFVPLLEADAQASVPKRCLFLWAPNGVISVPDWECTGTERSFELSAQMQPLERWKEQLTVISGVGTTAAFDGASERRGHLGLPTLMLTGRPNSLAGGRNAVVVPGMSLDQHLGQQISSDTVFQTLNFSAFYNSLDNFRYTVSYGPNGETLTPEDNPAAAFDRVFGGVTTGGPTGPDPNADRLSVLDAVRGELSALQQRVGTADRQKVEGHLDAIRDIETAIERRGSIECIRPAEPESVAFRNEAAIPEVSRIFIDMLVEAFKCDLTRVASMQWALWRAVMRWLGHTSTHHDVSHDSATQMTQAIQWINEETAYLMDRLAAVPEGSGTMLDNTLIVWFSEFGRGGQHISRDLPFMFAGGSALLPQGTGRFVKLGRSRSHVDLLTSVQQIMGAGSGVFGDARFSDGAISELV